MFGMSVFGELPIGALPILLIERLRVRRSPSYITVLIEDSTIYEMTTTDGPSLFDTSSGGSTSIYETTINDG